MDTNINEIAGLKEFTDWIRAFCKDSNVPDFTYNEDYKDIMEMSIQSLKDLDAEDCLLLSFTLMSYAGLLQNKLSLLKGQQHWCVEALDFLYSKYWNNYDKYLPSEIRKKSILHENTYANEVEGARIRLGAGIEFLEETVKDIKKRVNILQDLGKMRGYK